MIFGDSRPQYINSVSRKAFASMEMRVSTGKITEGRCFNFNARCFVTDKRLFGRKCVKVECLITTAIHYNYLSNYYFEPRRYTLWCLTR